MQKVHRPALERDLLENTLIAHVTECRNGPLRLEPDPLHYFLSYFLSNRERLTESQVVAITKTLEAKISSTHVPKFNTIAVKLFYSLSDLELPWSLEGKQKVKQFILQVCANPSSENGINGFTVLRQHLTKIKDRLNQDIFPFTEEDKQTFLDWIHRSADAPCTVPWATRDGFESRPQARQFKVEQPGMHTPRGVDSSALPPLEYGGQDTRKRRRVDTPPPVPHHAYAASGWPVPAASSASPIYDMSAAGTWVLRAPEQAPHPTAWSTVKEETYEYRHVRSLQSYGASAQHAIEIEPGEFVPAMTEPKSWDIDECLSRARWCGETTDHPSALPMLESVYERMKDLDDTRQGDYLTVRDAFLKLGALQQAARAEKRGPRNPRKPY